MWIVPSLSVPKLILFEFIHHFSAFLRTIAFPSSSFDHSQAGSFLLYLDSYEAFVCLANICQWPFFRAFLHLQPHVIASRFEFFGKLMQQFLPDVWALLERLELPPQLYFLEWCMTLFCRRLPLNAAHRIWDGVFLAGEIFAYRTALAVMKMLRPRLLAKPTFESCFHTLTKLDDDVEESTLFQAIQAIKIPSAFRSVVHVGVWE